MRKRLEELKRQGKNVPEIMAEVAEAATMAAATKAAEKTPPNTETGISGTNTRSGELKQHWATDSQTVPVGGGFSGGHEYHTTIANNMQYASYVNDGHRVDQHYVPGLIKNPYSGLLEMDSPEEGGIVVGTKTSFVPGIHMKEAAVRKYRSVVKKELKRRVEENFQ